MRCGKNGGKEKTNKGRRETGQGHDRQDTVAYLGS